MSAATMTWRRWRRTLVAMVTLALLLLPSACGRHVATPTQPVPLQLSPQVTAVSPPPRSPFVPYDSLQIWAQFAEPLDSTTVSTRTVFLKIDTRRLSVAVAWDAAHRRIVVTPLNAVQLRQTYTVQLSPNICSASGVPLGQTMSWQFAVNSVRRPSAPQPPNGTVGESPFVSLAWTGNGAGDGTASYEVFAGRDSAAVGARAVPAIYSGPLTRILPGTRWPQDGPVYWAVNTVSPTTGEHLRGPVWNFTAVSASLPVDSLQVPLSFTDYAWYDSRGWVSVVCKGSDIVFGPGYNAGLVWDFSAVPRTVRFAGARMILNAVPGYEDVLPVAATSLWLTTSTWTCTRASPYGPPWTDDAHGRLANGQVDARGRLRFESDTLTAHLEACVRLTGYYGYMLQATREVHCASQADAVLYPRLTLYVYRTAATALASTETRARAPAAAAPRARP